MRQVSDELNNHLQSGTTTLCTCWKVTRTDGAVLGFTDHDNDLTLSGQLYEAASGFAGSEAVSRVGLSVDNQEVHAALSSERLCANDLANGIYDNAVVEIFMVNWSDPSQFLLLRTGNIGEVSHGSVSFNAEIRGLSHHLQQPQGRTIQSLCDADLGDMRCGANVASAAFTATGEISEINSKTRFRVEGLDAFAEGWFSLGRLSWTGGDNNGATIEIKAHTRQTTGVWIETWQTPAIEPQNGDTLELIAGCNKQFGTCVKKFANQQNFRGFPHVPGNDFIIANAS